MPLIRYRGGPAATTRLPCVLAARSSGADGVRAVGRLLTPSAAATARRDVCRSTPPPPYTVPGQECSAFAQPPLQSAICCGSCANSRSGTAQRAKNSQKRAQQLCHQYNAKQQPTKSICKLTNLQIEPLRCSRLTARAQEGLQLVHDRFVITAALRCAAVRLAALERRRQEQALALRCFRASRRLLLLLLPSLHAGHDPLLHLGRHEEEPSGAVALYCS